MRHICWVALLLAVPAVAVAIDYGALNLELADLKADEDVKIYFVAFPSVEAHLEEAERAMRASLEMVAASRDQRPDRERRNAAAQLALLSGDRELRRFAPALIDRRDEAEEERRNEAIVGQAKLTLARLVESYRAIKAKCVAVREELDRREAAEKAKHRKR